MITPTRGVGRNDSSRIRSRRPNRFLVGLALAAIATAGAPLASASSLAGEVDPANAENPFDYVGRLHNEGLDRMTHEIATRGEEPNPGQVSFMAWKAALGTADAVGQVDVGALPFDGLANVVAQQDTQYPMLDDVQRHYLERLAEVASSPKLGARGKIEAFIILEVEVEARLGTKKATPILAAAAVGRYSTAYWYGQSAPTSGWNLYPDTGAFDHANASPNRHIEADIRGAVLGFVAGPEGMIAAGIITSGYSLLGALWDWIF